MEAVIYPSRDAKSDLLAFAGGENMLPLLNRPLLEHQLEWLADLGVQRATVLTDGDASPARAYFHSGERWGIELNFLVLNGKRTLPRLMRLVRGMDEVICLPANILLHMKPELPGLTFRENLAACAITAANAPGTHMGPFIMHPGHRAFATLCDLAYDETGIQDYLKNTPAIKGDFELIRGFADLHGAGIRALHAHMHMARGGREISPGVHLGYRAHIARDVVVNGPVCIGSDARVGSGAVLNSGTVIGDGCVVGAGCVLSNSVVMANTFIAPGIHLRDKIVHPEGIFDLRRGGDFHAPDSTMITRTLAKTDRVSAADRLLAGLLFLAGAAAAIRRRPSSRVAKRFVRKWRLLPAVCAGRIHLFGPSRKWLRARRRLDAKPALFQAGRAGSTSDVVMSFAARFASGFERLRMAMSRLKAVARDQ